MPLQTESETTFSAASKILLSRLLDLVSLLRGIKVMSVDKYTEEWHEREFIGYGMEQPNPEWPGRARVCVSFVVQYYMGAVSAYQVSPASTKPAS